MLGGLWGCAVREGKGRGKREEKGGGVDDGRRGGIRG